MPAFPRVHMDGAAANALANACLQIGKITAKEGKKMRDLTRGEA